MKRILFDAVVDFGLDTSELSCGLFYGLAV